ncbi:hypothetical protein [Nocardioides sp.]|uniref:hypothetical protein n=1 Tax=Nocardioides sp. TaxID=35761 RepID=UPI0027323992|nr:hypothetical protein [Nocardioides sp.]MDP3890363.1 hypothetical protein [Nocardioides sp.]
MAQAQHEDASAAIISVVGTLWPGATVELTRGRRRSPTADAEFIVMPHARSPRLLVPSSPPSAAARSMLRFSAAISPGETASRVAVAAALRLGSTAAFADRIRIAGGDPSLADHLGRLLGEPVTFSLGIGTARVNRKPVLQVFDQRGRTLAFAKIGDSPVSRADIAEEVTALRQLTDVSWRRLQIPRVLHYGDWGDHSVLLLSALPTRPQLPGRRAGRPPVDAMRELSETFAGPTMPLRELPWLAHHRQIADRLADPETGRRFRTCLDQTVALVGDHTITTGAWHGDWTPWNMARGAGLIRLWDFERFETGVPTGLDHAHYTVNATTRSHGTSPDTIRAGLALAGALPDDPGSAPHRRGALYLLAALSRYLPQTEVAGGEHIAHRAQQFLTTLETWLGSR